MNNHKPQILAPAGDKEAFLAALAAGADAVYAGLKHFSARMQADNFALKEMAALRELAERHGAHLHIPMNVLLKPGEADAAGRLIQRLNNMVQPHALIVQDLGVIDIARQAGFEGEIHLSTLANVSHPAGLAMLREKLGVDRVILPRELNVDEIKQFAEQCPEGMDLELFVHGALCYAVSGRCYWSSYFGGKSGLRGRCVQPCRRMYSHRGNKERLFSCRDLSLDLLVKTLLEVPKVTCWKIEGRKKSAHYVYHTVAAYRTLRDGNNSPESKKAAMDYLSMALGRSGTHYSFLPQKPHPAVTPKDDTGSGLLAGRTGAGNDGMAPLKPRLPLLRGDRLRVGYEDEPWHRIAQLGRNTPKGGTYQLRFPKKALPPKGTPVFLIDRRDPELVELLAGLEKELATITPQGKDASDFTAAPLTPCEPLSRHVRLDVWRSQPKGRIADAPGIWVRPMVARDVSRSMVSRIWWWMPPVIWPNEEDVYRRTLVELLRNKARNFVLGAPWQLGLFKPEDNIRAWAGPFCNIAGPQAVDVLRRLGFSGAIVSPELPMEDLLALPKQSTLPLGVVSGGMWPLCVSRTKAAEVKAEEPFYSPMKEVAWVRTYGQNHWVYPGWPLDISSEVEKLRQAGFSLFVNLRESKPKKVPQAKRTSRFNLDLKLL